MANKAIDMKRDNQRSITLVYNLVFHPHTKYIDIYYYYIWDKVIIERIELSYIPNSKMVTNRMTKSLI